MFKFYKKMNEMTRFSLWLSIATFLLTAVDQLLLGKFWYIPSPDDIHYSTGIVRVIKEPSKRNTTVDHVLFKGADGQMMHLACSYSASYYARRSGCSYGGRKEFYAEIHNKQAEIGWYIEKPFLGITNPYPQLISLKIEGKQHRSLNYKNRTMKMQGHRKVTIVYILIAAVFSTLMFLFLYKVYNPKIKE